MKKLNQFFHQFGFKQHPGKTFIGNVIKGFDWLGYQFNQTGVDTASPRTLANFNNKRCQLYEQARRVSATKAEMEQRVAEYVVRW